MASRIRSLLFPLLIYLAFFCSGAASLVSEVTWNRMLIVVVGNSLSATAMIIAVFMGGLGLGSFLAGRYFGGRRTSLLPYMTLELTIGLFVVVSPLVLHGVSGFFGSMAAGGISPFWLALARIFITLLALVVPALLMGATFPAIVAGTRRDTASGATARAGYLYSLNTLGAAIGCFAAGYHLLLEFGVQVTLNIALGLYLVAAFSALLAHLLRGAPASRSEAAPEQAAASSGPSVGLGRFLFPATFFIGFVSLAYEVLLTRMSILFLGNAVSVFSLVLTAFLLGTGISSIGGTWLYGWLQRRGRNADGLFPVLVVLAAVFIVATPYALLSDRVLGMDRYARLAEAGPINPLPILGLLILPTILIGALLPLAIRMLGQGDGAQTTRNAANLYTLNTIGGLLGAAVANHFLVPLMGMQGVLLLLGAGLLFVGLRGSRSGGAGRPWWQPAVGATVALVLGLLLLPDMIHMYAHKVAQGTRADHSEVLLVREGKAATVTVVDQDDPRRGTYRDMYLNGVEEASTRYWHVQLFKLLGILPPVLHDSDQPMDAMVIAFGAGITAGSVLASDQVGSLDVADLNPDIEGINDHFTEVNGDVFHKDRFHFHNEDGRNFLLTGGKQYDLIIGDSTHPRAYDSWILYTREFYELVASRLKPGGIFAQWVPVLGSMRGELMNIHLNTFRSVFPNTTLWYVYGSDQAFLMATPAPLEIDVPAVEARLARLPAWFRAEEYQVDTLAHISGFFWLSPASLDLMVGGETRINTDDQHFFGKQSALWPLAPQRQLPAFQTSFKPHLRGADEALLTAIDREQKAAGHLGRYGFFMDRQELEDAFCLHPDNGNARYFMGLERGGQIPDPADMCEDPEVRNYRNMLASHPHNSGVLNALAATLEQKGRLAEALEYAGKAVALDPDNGMILDTLGWLQHQLGRTAEARVTLEKADAHLPDHPIVLYHLGAVLEKTGETTAARSALVRALSLNPGPAERRAIQSQLESLEE